MVARKLSLLLLVLGVSFPAWSRDTSRYKVEVVVFESLDQSVLQSEFWPADPGVPSVAGALELEGAETDTIADYRCRQQSQNCQHLGPSIGEPRDANQQEFYLLPAAQHDLNGVVKSLEASGRYRPLAHIAWQQPALTRRRAIAVRIMGGWPRAAALSVRGRSSPASHHANGSFVDGSLRLYRGRYLHVLADFVFYRSQAPQFPAEAQQQAFFDGGQQVTPKPTRFRLSEHRRMRSRELHYLDHPLFGLVVQVTPYLDPQSPPLAPADSKLKNDG